MSSEITLSNVVVRNTINKKSNLLFCLTTQWGCLLLTGFNPGWIFVEQVYSTLASHRSGFFKLDSFERWRMEILKTQCEND